MKQTRNFITELLLKIKSNVTKLIRLSRTAELDLQPHFLITPYYFAFLILILLL